MIQGPRLRSVTAVERARLVDPVDGCHPEIEHAVDRRAKGDPRAVATDPHDASFGIGEKQAAAKEAGARFLVGHDPDPRVK
jgi:hypothetical protein